MRLNLSKLPFQAPHHSATPHLRHIGIRCSSQREAKDPSSYASIEDLRRELEQATGQAPFTITKSIQWLSDAANNTEIAGKGARILAFQAYKFVLGITPEPWRGVPDDIQGIALAQIEASMDPAVLEQLQTVLLSTKISTLKLLRRYPPLKNMDLSDLMLRLVTLKALFPGSDVARMIELTPSAFLGDNWPETEALLQKNSSILRRGLEGAEVDFMFQEDPTILFEGTESLEVGLRRLKELWDIDATALRNSDPLELALAVKALGLNGPPKSC